MLKTNLAALRKQWLDAGKPVRTERMRDLEFSVFPVSSNNMPKALSKIFPLPYDLLPQPGDAGAQRAAAVSDVAAGNVDLVLDTIAGLMTVGQRNRGWAGGLAADGRQFAQGRGESCHPAHRRRAAGAERSGRLTRRTTWPCFATRLSMAG